jgi:hypothetical protein
MTRDVHPGYAVDLNFLHIPDPGVKKAPDPGSESVTLVASVPGRYRSFT